MRYALISDIHGNREALDAVFEEIEGRDCDSVLCLGDIVGYGPDPNYCVETIRRKADAAILGNHDEAVLNKDIVYSFNRYARAAALWTSETLQDKNKQFLRGLTYSIVTEDIFLVHSSPDNPQEWNYILSGYDAQRQFRFFDQKTCFIGHTHYPIEFRERNSSRRIINIGSVGQPRDDDPRACFYIYDSLEDIGEWVRVKYPVEKTADKIRNCELPEFLPAGWFGGG